MVSMQSGFQARIQASLMWSSLSFDVVSRKEVVSACISKKDVHSSEVSTGVLLDLLAVRCGIHDMLISAELVGS